MQTKDEDLSHIRDSSQRKKIQNRIAQRAYRKRLKSRMEELESFRQATTAAQTPPFEAIDPEIATSKDHSKQYHRPQHCQETPASSVSLLYDLKGRSNSPNAFTAISYANIERTPPITHLGSPVYPTTPVTPSMDVSAIYMPDHDLPGCGMWDELQTGLNVHEIIGTGDQNTHESPCSDFMKELTKDVRVHDATHDGKTALHVAAENGKLSTVQLLLTLQPDVLLRDSMGRTVLHLAVYNQHQGVVDELVKHSACLEARDWSGQTALHIAAAHGHEGVVASLLASGAVLESKDNKGQTPFHLAAAHGQDRILQILFSRGANINARM